MSNATLCYHYIERLIKLCYNENVKTAKNVKKKKSEVFTSVLLTKNVKSIFTFFVRVMGTFDENCSKYFFLHFSFSVATNNVKILLRAGEVFERQNVFKRSEIMGDIITAGYHDRLLWEKQ